MHEFKPANASGTVNDKVADFLRPERVELETFQLPNPGTIPTDPSHVSGWSSSQPETLCGGSTSAQAEAEESSHFGEWISLVCSRGQGISSPGGGDFQSL